MVDTIIQDEASLAAMATAAPSRVAIAPCHSTGSGDAAATAVPAAPPTGVLALVSIWRRIVLFVGGVFVILSAAEGYLVLTEPDTVGTPSFNAREAAPYVEFYSKPNFTGRCIITNDAGFRYGPLPVEKPAGAGWKASSASTAAPPARPTVCASATGRAGRRSSAA